MKMGCVVEQFDFNPFFRRLHFLNCQNIFSLTCVPFDVLLNKNHNFYQNAESRNKLKTLKIRHTVTEDYGQEQINLMNNHISKFNQYQSRNRLKQTCIRGIKCLDVYLGSLGGAKHVNILAKQILSSYGSICELFYHSRGSIMFESLNELQQTFHKGLTQFCLGNRANMYMSIGFVNTRLKQLQQQQEQQSQVKIGNLREITVSGPDIYEEDMLTTFDMFDVYSMRRDVKRYIINWYPGNLLDASLNGVNFDILNKILLQDYIQHPSLKEVNITFGDDRNLCTFAKLMTYFNHYYDKIFVERKLYSKYFEKIVLTLREIEQNCTININQRLIQSFPLQVAGIVTVHEDMQTIFQQKNDAKYPSDETMIEIHNVKRGLEWFGTIYQNVIGWLRKRQENHTPNVCQDCVSDCKIVFSL